MSRSSGKKKCGKFRDPTPAAGEQHEETPRAQEVPDAQTGPHAQTARLSHTEHENVRYHLSRELTPSHSTGKAATSPAQQIGSMIPKLHQSEDDQTGDDLDLMAQLQEPLTNLRVDVVKEVNDGSIGGSKDHTDDLAHIATNMPHTEASEFDSFEVVAEWSAPMDDDDDDDDDDNSYVPSETKKPAHSMLTDGTPDVCGNSSSNDMMAKTAVNYKKSTPSRTTDIVKRVASGNVPIIHPKGTRLIAYPPPASLLTGGAATGDLLQVKYNYSQKKSLKRISLLGAPTASPAISGTKTSLLASPISTFAAAVEFDSTRQFSSRRLQICSTPGCSGEGNKDKRLKRHHSVISCPNIKSGRQSKQTSAKPKLEVGVLQKGAAPATIPGTSKTQPQPEQLFRSAECTLKTDQHLQTEKNNSQQDSMRDLFLDLKDAVPSIKTKPASESVILMESKQYIEHLTTRLQISEKRADKLEEEVDNLKKQLESLWLKHGRDQSA
ncbi:hypothetical protein BsWGS_27549 [Bradybaena similaris]